MRDRDHGAVEGIGACVVPGFAAMIVQCRLIDESCRFGVPDGGEVGNVERCAAGEPVDLSVFHAYNGAVRWIPPKSRELRVSDRRGRLRAADGIPTRHVQRSPASHPVNHPCVRDGELRPPAEVEEMGCQ